MRVSGCGLSVEEDRVAGIVYITDKGRKLAERIKETFPEGEVIKFAPGTLNVLWGKCQSLIFIMAAGIVVRSIAPMLKDKKTDPAVVVLDEEGKFAVSLVSGHLGGANELARKIAAFLGAEPVITTASDVNNLPSIDIWARDNNLLIENWELLPKVGARYVNNGGLRVYSDITLKLPDEFLRVIDPRFADVIITRSRDVYAGSPRCSIIGESCSTGACRVKEQVYLRPIDLIAGIGCNSGASGEEIEAAVESTLQEHNIVFSSVAGIATIDIKANEPGLKSFADKYGLPMATFTAGELNSVDGIERSEAVFNATGAFAVAEPAALLGSGKGRLLAGKQKKGNVTVAIAEKIIK